MTYAEAISKSLLDIMDSNPKAIIAGISCGDGVTEVFGTIRECVKKYPDRVVNFPVAENLLHGWALGMSLAGYFPIVCHQRTDFMLMGFDQLINHIAIWEGMTGHKTPMIIRAIVGRGWGQGPQHMKDVTPALEQFGMIVHRPVSPDGIAAAYAAACEYQEPMIIVEYRHLFDKTAKEIIDMPDPRYCRVYDSPGYCFSGKQYEDAFYSGSTDKTWEGPF